MKYTTLPIFALILLLLLCACDTPTQQPAEYETTVIQTGGQYQSSWVTGITKSAAAQNAAVAEWLETCARPERDDIGHYVLHNAQENGNGTVTHHLLLYRSATEKDAADFTVSFAASDNVLVITPTYTSSESAAFGYDLIYLTLQTESNTAISVEMLVDGDYPGVIQSTTAQAFSPDTFGTQADE